MAGFWPVFRRPDQDALHNSARERSKRELAQTHVKQGFRRMLARRIVRAMCRSPVDKRDDADRLGLFWLLTRARFGSHDGTTRPPVSRSKELLGDFTHLPGAERASGGLLRS